MSASVAFFATAYILQAVITVTSHFITNYFNKGDLTLISDGIRMLYVAQLVTYNK